MKRTKKKRKMDNYAMGSGATGTIKNYMPDPNEVFRQDEINADIAIAEAGANPFVVGLHALGGATTQFGMSTLSKGIGAKMNTGGQVQGGAIEVEGGEVIEDSKGVRKQKGNSHAGSGEVINAEPGTKIFSDADANSELPPEIVKLLSPDGVTMADKKMAREKSVAKLEKKLAKDPSDLVTKESLKRTIEKNALEEKQDLELQGFAREMNAMYNAAMGTGPEGLPSYNTGTDDEWWANQADKREKDNYEGDGNYVDWGSELKGFASSFTGGDAIGMFGNLYSGLAPLFGAKRNAAKNTPNVNQYKDFGKDAIDKVEEAKGLLPGLEAKAITDVDKSARTSRGRNRGSARGVNTVRALDLGTEVAANKAKTDIYSKYASMMMDNLYQQSGLENQQDQMVMQGAAAADLANRQDSDNAATQIGVAKETLGRGIQTIGKELNQNKRSNMLANLAANLSKYGLAVDDDGNLIKKTV